MIWLRRILLIVLTVTILMLHGMSPAWSAGPIDGGQGERMLAAYFRHETARLAAACLADVQTWEDWTGQRLAYRQQLREMLGIDPLPERTPLAAVVTGVIDHGDFTVEKLHFQSRPALYVTANLYVPKKRSGPVPAVLYLCGHSPAKKDGISYGNKTQYQHHAAWFARHGYVCLVLDTLQLGEIEGIHHGTYRENMWWWNAAGYTPAGVEAWNAIRALDYLETRPEVDADRLGVTGRSGGGAYSWWLAALDDRIKVAVPVAGITTLKNHVVDGCVEGHCDCMYLVNTYRWDYAQVAALVAPRPLLVANTDHDEIFPLDGVMSLYWNVRHLYDLAGKPKNLGLQIAAGPHADTQVLQLHAFQWFNHHLLGDEAPFDSMAPSYFGPEQLKVFAELPTDAINTRVHESFTRIATAPAAPATTAEWRAQRSEWLAALHDKCFRGWPNDAASQRPPQARQVFEAQSGEVQLTTYEFDSQENVSLRLYVLAPLGVPAEKLERVVMHPLDSLGWTEFSAGMRANFANLISDELAPSSEAPPKILPPLQLVSRTRADVYFAPRGVGPTAWDSSDSREQTHIRRRFMLLGQTLDGMRVWDVRRAIQSLRTIDGFAAAPVWLDADREMAGIALYAALFEPNVAGLQLRGLSKTHRDGPDFLNVLRILDVPQAVAMAAENSRVRIEQDDHSGWDYPLAVAENLGWSGRIEIQPTSARSP